MISKYVFAAILCMHGLIHLMGFTHAFGYSEPSQFTVPVSKLAGIMWLMTAVGFLVTVILYLTKKNWMFVAVLTSIASQIMIILFGNDAKAGTLINILVVIAAIHALGRSAFKRRNIHEIKNILPDKPLPRDAVKGDQLNDLPPIVRNWLIQCGVEGKRNIHSVRLKQKGEMRLRPGSGWMTFTAIQYFNVDEPAFHWQVDVRKFSFPLMNGRDYFYNGKGHMQILIYALFKVVDANDDEKINSGTMLRYLAEICWFPTAALSPYIRWEQVSPEMATAEMNRAGTSVKGEFYFNGKGEITRFRALRYYGTEASAKQEVWEVQTKSYKIFQGMKIPTRCRVSWKLHDGEFNWANIEITEVEYNVAEKYE